MLRLIGLVVSIGLADSLNPSTIAPALYIATGEHPRARVAEFTFGVFAVYFIGGALMALGPGQLLLALVPKPRAETRYILETIVGGLILFAGALLWIYRDRLAERKQPDISPSKRSTAILGATITAVELPTAFPYFAAIAAIVGSGFGPLHQLFLLVLFNVCFVLPLLAIFATLWFAGAQTDRVLAAVRDFLARRWPVLLAGLALIAGVFVTVLGITGLAAGGHGHVGRLSRGVRRMLTP